MADVRMDYLEIATPILAGSVARTVELHSDLRIDVDVEGYVLGVERDGDDVRMLDLEEVVRELRHVEPGNLSKVLVVSGCGHWWRESRPEGLIVASEPPNTTRKQQVMQGLAGFPETR